MAVASLNVGVLIVGPKGTLAEFRMAYQLISQPKTLLIGITQFTIRCYQLQPRHLL